MRRRGTGACDRRKPAHTHRSVFSSFINPRSRRVLRIRLLLPPAPASAPPVGVLVAVAAGAPTRRRSRCSTRCSRLWVTRGRRRQAALSQLSCPAPPSRLHLLPPVARSSRRQGRERCCLSLVLRHPLSGPRNPRQWVATGVHRRPRFPLLPHRRLRALSPPRRHLRDPLPLLHHLSWH